ncbi:MAG: SET domain-containing protein-lysine N-methyltransferase [Candidatus Krumholzibacteriia bacterium]
MTSPQVGGGQAAASVHGGQQWGPALQSPAQVTPPFKTPVGVEVVPVPGKGLGVIARAPIRAGDVIETCPMLLVADAPPDPYQAAARQGGERFDDLEDYYFAWTEGRVALALGLGGLYNHSNRPNARNIKHFDAARMTIEAVRDIQPGQEITISYHVVWFDPLD